MRLGKPIKLALDEQRSVGLILFQFMFPPANRQVAAKWLSVVEIRANNRCLEIESKLHNARISNRAWLFCNWNKRYARVLEIERESVVSQKVAAENAGLLKTRCLIDQIEIERDRSDALTGMTAKGNFREQK